MVQQYRKSPDRFMSDYIQESRFESLVMKICAEKKITFQKQAFSREQKNIALAVKARLAHRLFGTEGQIRVYVMQADPLVNVASTVLGPVSAAVP
jgi:carboxyl-terminal processing protease